MISTANTILAIALPLGLCLTISVSMVVILYHRLVLVRRDRCQQQEPEPKLSQAQIEEDRKRLAMFPKPIAPGYPDLGFSNDELIISYRDTYSAHGTMLSEYIKKWLLSEKKLPPIPDEVSRLEGLLFPQAPADDSLSTKWDLAIFPNPQQYTSAEIVTRLSSADSYGMCHHILTSVILRNTSIRGNLSQSLLSILGNGLVGLRNLYDAVQNGLELEQPLQAHICRFGYYKAEFSTEYEMNIGNQDRKRYHTFFEAVFQPYFKSNSPEAVAERRQDLYKVFDAAVAHGMICLGSMGEVNFKWGEKTHRIELRPAMTVDFKIDGHTYQPVLVESGLW